MTQQKSGFNTCSHTLCNSLSDIFCTTELGCSKYMCVQKLGKLAHVGMANKKISILQSSTGYYSLVAENCVLASLCKAVETFTTLNSLAAGCRLLPEENPTANAIPKPLSSDSTVATWTFHAWRLCVFTLMGPRIHWRLSRHRTHLIEQIQDFSSRGPNDLLIQFHLVAAKMLPQNAAYSVFIYKYERKMNSINMYVQTN